ncbi:hypothetical protein CRUP_020009 [Coryphaenoides rupestris]|nr:hypothetical protein CRUP_020009 [Coryphaenoides rupestris]
MEVSVVNLYDKFLEFIQMVRNFEECRKKWLHTDEALGSCKEVLAKAETERGSLEVKLKHARNQERQLQLIRDLLISETNSSSVHLSEGAAERTGLPQRPLPGRPDCQGQRQRQSQDWDSSVIRPVKLTKRQKRVNESVVTKTTITVPANGGRVEAVSTIETVRTRSGRKSAAAPVWMESTTDQSETTSEAPSMPFTEAPPTPRTPRINTAAGKKHNFVPKTVIRSELCQPCGRRTKFGKVYLRCQDCRAVTHPECRERCPLPCNPSALTTPPRTTVMTLADFAPSTSPMVPPLVVYCIKEIERRGLHETYKSTSTTKFYKNIRWACSRLRARDRCPVNRTVEGTNAPRGSKTPAAPEQEIQDEDNSLAMVYQAVGELPGPNRDTLACLMIHLQKVSQSTQTKMDVHNLARVFGPTLVGHAVAEPDPITILQDTSRQPRVVERLLKIPASYWTQFVPPENLVADHHGSYPDLSMHNVSMLGPVTTPEHQMMTKTASSGSLSKRMLQTFSSTTL